MFVFESNRCYSYKSDGLDYRYNYIIIRKSSCYVYRLAHSTGCQLKLKHCSIFLQQEKNNAGVGFSTSISYEIIYLWQSLSFCARKGQSTLNKLVVKRNAVVSWPPPPNDARCRKMCFPLCNLSHTHTLRSTIYSPTEQSFLLIR